MDINGKKILVTGGAGFVGSHLADALVGKGARVIVVDNLVTGVKENINPKAVFYELDFNEPEFEDVFKKESGVIWKKYVSIPYERIQNVDIYRGVFARILGLSDLHIQTAGASVVSYGRGGLAGVGAEGRLPGIGKDVAEKLRDGLIKRAK